MRKAITLACCALAGCATQVTPWPQVSVIDLCYQTLYGNGQNRSGAELERQRRELDCQPYYPAIIAREQQRDQAMQNAANYFLPRPQAAPPIRPTTSCRTIPSGNGWQTECN